MKTGIIAEGKSDLAVIINILKGKLGIDQCDIQPLLPELFYDETDLFKMREEQFSNWTIVKKKCLEGTLLNQFFEGLIDDRFLVVHIDSAERFETGFEVKEPKKEDVPELEYVDRVRTAIVSKLNDWLGGEFNDRIVFAVAVEETEAWLIPIFKTDIEETGLLTNPKRQLEQIISRTNLLSDKEKKRLSQMDKFEEFYEISRSFRKRKSLGNYVRYNLSLKIFCEELEKFQTSSS